MNKKKLAIYICIIIVFCNVLIVPKKVEAECIDKYYEVMAALVAAAASSLSTGEAKDFIDKINEAFSKIDFTPCDKNGNPIAVPTTDPNITSGPTPTVDPNAPTPPPSDGSLPFFCQLDGRLQTSGNPPSGVIPPIINAGCGPTSLSMVYCKKKYDNSSKWSCNIQSADIAKELTKVGAYGPQHGGTYLSASLGVMRSYLGLTVIPLSVNQGDISETLKAWKDHIDKGYYIWTYSTSIRCGIGCSNPEKKLAHIFLIDEIDIDNKKLRLRSSSSCNSSTSYEENISEQWYDTSILHVGTGISTNVGYAIK